MASKAPFLFMTVALFLVSAASGRKLPAEADDITARLEGASGVGGLMECWNALYELKTCTNEIVLFFLNGQTSLGPECCLAIHVITTNCWPAMLTSLGFTLDEANVLRGYCQNPDSGGSSPAPSPDEV